MVCKRDKILNIELSKRAVKTLSEMDSQTKTRILNAIKQIPSGDIKPLKGYKGYYRLRVGGWRIIFTYKDNGDIIILKIAPRGEVYKGGF